MPLSRILPENARWVIIKVTDFTQSLAMQHLILVGDDSSMTNKVVCMTQSKLSTLLMIALETNVGMHILPSFAEAATSHLASSWESNFFFRRTI